MDHLGPRLWVVPGKAGHFVPDRQVHEVVITGVKIYLIDAHAIAVKRLQFRRISVGLIRLFESFTRAREFAELGQLGLGPGAPLPLDALSQGLIAGPRMLEHMVDTVLYFEGDQSHQFRILRAVKNRYGATDEIGVFQMTDSGLDEVANPSALFLAERDEDVSGTAVFAGMEGTRPVLVEIQSLTAASALGTPRRAVVGCDSGRLALIMAVLEARCGLALGCRDVYLNVVGGLKIG